MPDDHDVMAQRDALLRSVSILTEERDRYYGMLRGLGDRYNKLRARHHGVQHEARRLLREVERDDLNEFGTPNRVDDTVLGNDMVCFLRRVVE